MKKAPIIRDLKKINLPQIIKHTGTSLPCYYIQGNDLEIVKMQFIFPAGRRYESKPAVSRLTNMLLKEGCGRYSGEEFATLIDNFGFALKTSADLDFAYITFICLRKYFQEGFHLVNEMLSDPLFKEEDISRIANVSAQSLNAQLDKNELVCYREFTKSIFGSRHVYGYNTLPEDFKNVTRSEIKSFHENYYELSKMKIILAGAIDTELLAMINYKIDFKPLLPTYHMGSKVQSSHLSFKTDHDLQVAIRYGKRLFSRRDPEYPDLFILNTILGGYFGSRLMRNIREDKGYAYNIFSSIETMSDDGYIAICCEVNQEHVDSTFREIHKEIRLLQSEEIPDQELKMVRNYMLGQLMNSLDGPFASAEMLTSLIGNQLDLVFLDKLINRIKLITTFELRSIARKHLNVADFTSVVVGAEN